MKDNIVLTKSYAFSLRIIKLYQHMTRDKQEFVLSKQLLRSGTSIGANIEEGIGGISPRDFINKLTIAYKEARETHYWLRLLADSGYIDKRGFNSIEKDCQELLKLLFSIINTSKSNISESKGNSQKL